MRIIVLDTKVVSVRQFIEKECKNVTYDENELFRIMHGNVYFSVIATSRHEFYLAEAEDILHTTIIINANDDVIAILSNYVPMHVPNIYIHEFFERALLEIKDIINILIKRSVITQRHTCKCCGDTFVSKYFNIRRKMCNRCIRENQNTIKKAKREAKVEIHPEKEHLYCVIKPRKKYQFTTKVYNNKGEMIGRVCNNCGVLKRADAFYQTRGYCTKCAKKENKEYYKIRRARIPTQIDLLPIFEYNKETGDLVWRIGKNAGKKAGFVTAQNYLAVNIPGFRQMYVHQVVWILHGYELTPGKMIDHIDGNPFNNKIGNLREVTLSTNVLSSTKRRKNSTTGYTGVCFNKGIKKYTARIIHKKKFYHLGTFDKLEDAIAARAEAEIDRGIITDTPCIQFIKRNPKKYKRLLAKLVKKFTEDERMGISSFGQVSYDPEDETFDYDPGQDFYVSPGKDCFELVA